MIVQGLSEHLVFQDAALFHGCVISALGSLGLSVGDPRDVGHTAGIFLKKEFKHALDTTDFRGLDTFHRRISVVGVPDRLQRVYDGLQAEAIRHCQVRPGNIQEYADTLIDIMMSGALRVGVSVYRFRTEHHIALLRRGSILSDLGRLRTALHITPHFPDVASAIQGAIQTHYDIVPMAEGSFWSYTLKKDRPLILVEIPH